MSDVRDPAAPTSSGDPTAGDDATWRDGWPVGPPELCQQVFLDDGYGRATLDAEGRIIHLNPSVATLVDRPIDEIRGHHFSEFLTPASLELARAVFTQVVAVSESDVPIDLEIARPDGTTIPVEVGAIRYFDHPEHPGLHLRMRPAALQRWVERFLTQMVSGAPLAACFEPLARAFDAAVPGARTSIVYDRDGSTFASAVGPSVDPAVWDAAQAAPDELFDADHVPWLKAVLDDVPRYEAVRDLTPHLRVAAEANGYAACWAFPVTVPPDAAPAAAVVMYRSTPGPPLAGQAQAATNLRGLVALAIERHRSHQRLVRAATHDSLTSLLNRGELVARLSRSLADDREQARLAVLYLDLDDFKPVNDEYGHRFGDDLLAVVGQRLRGSLRSGDDIARVGGDEFVMVCRGVDDISRVSRVAEDLLAKAAQPFRLGDSLVKLGASIGIALAPDHGSSAGELIDAADQGLYLAKNSGRGCSRLSPARRIR